MVTYGNSAMMHHMKQGYFIELVGPPGAGKSTFLAAALAEHPDWLDVRVAAWKQLLQESDSPVPYRTLWQYLPARWSQRIFARRQSKLYRAWLGQHADITTATLLATVETAIERLATPEADRHWLHANIQTAVAQHMLAYRCAKANGLIVLADELCLQRTISLFYARPTTDTLTHLCEQYLLNIPKPDAIVSCAASAEILWHRANNRSRGLPGIWRDITQTAFSEKVVAINALLAKLKQHPAFTGIPHYDAPQDMDYQSFFATLLPHSTN